MLNNKIIAVVVPAYNEESQVGRVIETMPEFVDRIVVINDCSKDGTAEVVMHYIKTDTKPKKEINDISKEAFHLGLYNKAELLNRQKEEECRKLLAPAEIINRNPDIDRIILINHLKNSKKGKAIANGYQWCKDHNIDCIAIMDGDGQMDPSELERICRPIVEEGIDYVKGNRLIHMSAWLVIPKMRYLGNSFLSIITKIASGYWRISDSQAGFTAISKKALHTLRLHQMYPTYGLYNDLLAKLNISYCTLREVEIKPVYGIGEQSKMKISKIILPISFLFFKSFFRRLWVKYFFRDFHPLFLFYNLAFLLGVINIHYLIKIIAAYIDGKVLSYEPLLAFMFLSISSLQALFFAMWMDIHDNEKLYK